MRSASAAHDVRHYNLQPGRRLGLQMQEHEDLGFFDDGQVLHAPITNAQRREVVSATSTLRRSGNRR